MIIKSKVLTIGNSLGIVLTKEILNKLNIDKGDEVILIETSSGVQIITHDPEFEKQMEIFDETRKKYRNTLRMLSKS